MDYDKPKLLYEGSDLTTNLLYIKHVKTLLIRLDWLDFPTSIKKNQIEHKKLLFLLCGLKAK